MTPYHELTPEEKFIRCAAKILAADAIKTYFKNKEKKQLKKKKPRK